MTIRLAAALCAAIACVPALHAAAAEPVAPAVSAWMSWEDGVDLVGVTSPDLKAPNVILHVAKMVHTPAGSAASGMVLYQPDPAQPPLVSGFISTDPALAAWFGPHIFAGTPFEKAPAQQARISIETNADRATSHIEVGGHVFTVELSGLAPTTLVDRAPGAWPFRQQGVERAAGAAVVTVDGKPITVIIPPPAPGQGANAVHAPAGLYIR
jgi:hypothetical protein